VSEIGGNAQTRAQTGLPIDQIAELIDYIGDTSIPEASYIRLRHIELDESFNDAETMIVPEVQIIQQDIRDHTERPPFREFRRGDTQDIVAVDSGMIRLGETSDGLFIALRGSIVIDSVRGNRAYLAKTGPLFLSYETNADLLYRIGRDLLQPDLFVELDEEGNPSSVKRGAADAADQYADRFRNWFERMLQRTALGMISNGLLLVDGALTRDTRDTPREFIDLLATEAAERNIALVGISKKSKIIITNREIQFWLDDQENVPGYRRLSTILTERRQERVLGNIYAIRFTPAGPTFRMDANPIPGQSDREVIDTLTTNCLMRAGYPDILVRAHAYSYFTSGDVILLQSIIRANHRIIPKLEVNLTPIFAPFGGRFK
jgi:hypothetical protein